MGSLVGHKKIFKDFVTLADEGRLGHGYVFWGPAMVGKRLTAQLIAEYLENGAGVLSDMMLVVPGENNSIGIDAIRGIKNFLWQKPNVSPRRTLIIDDAELMTTEAQNALLKIAEEPPVSSLLILATSDAQGIMPTILSRLPAIYFGAVPQKEIEAWLGKKEIAAKSFGKPGLAWRLIHDKAFAAQLESAGRLLRAPAASRRDVIKKIIEPEDFNFRKFLDAVIINLAWDAATGRSAVGRGALWHRTLTLYDRETNFSLNPRIQLEYLLSS